MFEECFLLNIYQHTFVRRWNLVFVNPGQLRPFVRHLVTIHPVSTRIEAKPIEESFGSGKIEQCVDICCTVGTCRVLRRTQNPTNDVRICLETSTLQPISSSPPNLGPSHSLVREKQDEQYDAEGVLTSTTETPPTWVQNHSLLLRRNITPYNLIGAVFRRTQNPYNYFGICLETSKLRPI